VTAADRRGGRFSLTTDDVEATLLALLADGRRLPDLQVRGASLEEAVLSLTSRSRTPIGADR
jgi:ABC-2 type transport system ATP-binding protein